MGIELDTHDSFCQRWMNLIVSVSDEFLSVMDEFLAVMDEFLAVMDELHSFCL